MTGASRGIGKAIALRLAAEGAAVVVSASRLGAHGELSGTLEEVVEQIRAAGGRAAAETANLANEVERADLVSRAAAHFGDIDILVNNAAMIRWSMPSATPLKDRRKLLEVNLLAPIDLAQQALPSMRARRRGGSSISAATRPASRPFPTATPPKQRSPSPPTAAPRRR